MLVASLGLTPFQVPHRNNCFEVWGFDIMLDDMFHAWLIEVNTCPSLAADSPLDRHVKNAMLSDVMNLVGVVPYDQEVYSLEHEARRQARLTGLPHRAAVTGGGGSGTPVGISSPKAVSGGAASSGGMYSSMPRTVQEAEDMDFRGDFKLSSGKFTKVIIIWLILTLHPHVFPGLLPPHTS